MLDIIILQQKERHQYNTAYFQVQTIYALPDETLPDIFVNYKRTVFCLRLNGHLIYHKQVLFLFKLKIENDLI